MLFTALRSHDMVTILISLLSSAFVVFCTLPLQEFAKAYVATKLGDSTPKYAGKLTLNPMAHVNPIGAIMLVLVGFGWGNPVPVDERNFKKPRRDMVLYYLAGPVTSLLVALIFMIIMNIMGAAAGEQSSTFVMATYTFFYYASYINIMIAVINLLPIPPFSGYRVLQMFLPADINYKIMMYENYIVIGVILFIYLFTKPLIVLVELVYAALYALAGLPFNLF